MPKIIAIDPGKHTGIARWPKCKTETYEAEDISVMTDLVHWHNLSSYDLVIVEDYKDYTQFNNKHSEIPMSIVHILKGQAEIGNINLEVQSPLVKRMAKGQSKLINKFEPMATQHEKDAAYHIIAYLLTKGYSR